MKCMDEIVCLCTSIDGMGCYIIIEGRDINIGQHGRGCGGYTTSVIGMLFLSHFMCVLCACEYK